MDRHYWKLPYYLNVLRGIAYITEHFPGGMDKLYVNLDKLDMAGYPQDAFALAGCGLSGDLFSGNKEEAYYGMIISDEHLDFHTETDKLQDTWIQLIEVFASLPNLPAEYLFVGQGHGQLRKTFKQIGFDQCQAGGTTQNTTDWDFLRDDGSRTDHFYIVPRDKVYEVIDAMDNEQLSSTPKRYEIKTDGSVEFGGTIQSSEKVQDFISHIDGHLFFTREAFGHNCTVDLQDVTRFHIGCKEFTGKELIEFAREYRKKEWKKPERKFKPGDRLVNSKKGSIYEGHTYVLCKLGINGQAQLVMLDVEKGENWSGPVSSPITQKEFTYDELKKLGVFGSTGEFKPVDEE